jgi:hypothetical protein
MRAILRNTFAALALTALPLAAHAQQAGDADTLLSDCGRQGLTNGEVDSCLERVRVREETAPSPDLQSLEAQLEQESRGQTAPPSVSANSADSGPTANAADMTPPSAGDAPEAQEQATAQPRSLNGTLPEANTEGEAPAASANSAADNNDLLSGPDGTDEPPVADPPDNGMSGMSDTSRLDPDAAPQPPDQE